MKRVFNLTKHKYESSLTPVRVPQASVDNHTYTYNSIGKLATINQDVLDYELTYGVNEQRIEAVKKEYGQVVYTKQYINSASMETKNGEELTYLYAEGQPFAIHKKTVDDEMMYYLHLDHLGSIMSITDQSGIVVETRSYDAWGRPQDPNTWSYQLTPFGALNITDRGYTFHEHLIEFSLINMNGRMYDPVLGRVISPDNYIQAPDNTQSFNRYSYCFNNPLKYSDPSGDIVGTAFTFLWDFTATVFTKGGIDPWNTSKNRQQAWSNFDPTMRGTKTNNAWRIDMGMFQTDSKRPWYERAGQLFLRFTWEAPQSGMGYIFSHIRNVSGNVDNVDYYGGATVVNKNDNSFDRWGLTLGSYINSKNMKASPEDGLFRHEYGHVLQSRIAGPTYLTGVGLPSLLGGGLQMAFGRSFHNHNTEWYETNANQLGLKYFNTHEKEVMKHYPWRYEYYPTQYNLTWYWLIGNPIASPWTYLLSLTL